MIKRNSPISQESIELFQTRTRCVSYRFQFEPLTALLLNGLRLNPKSVSMLFRQAAMELF